MLLILVLLLSSVASAEYIYTSTNNNLVLVGLKFSDLHEIERDRLRARNIIEMDLQSDWYNYVQQSKTPEVVMLQNSGFIGLYTANGYLVRELKPSPDIALRYQVKHQQVPSTYQVATRKEWDQIGYNTGGRRDPYRAQDVFNPNQQNLAPGWGYNEVREKPSKWRRTLGFLNYFPLDPVTPLNYPGNFDSGSLTAAYGLGVIPHVFGFAAATERASQDKTKYDQFKPNPPAYSEYPVQYSHPDEPDNPISGDPNFYRQYPMPQAFQQAHPNYEYDAQQYRKMYSEPIAP